jgi:hypothetical protein
VKDVRERFWDFVAERHRIWDRRYVEEQVPPWTTDPLLRNYHFTNVYRLLDPGTEWFLRWREQHAERPPAEHLLNALVYRAVASEQGMRNMGWLSFTPGAHERAAHAATRSDFWTKAYFVRPFGTGDRAVGLGNLVRGWVERARVLGLLAFAPTQEAFCRYAQAHLPSVGPFVAYQVMVDLSYPRARILRFDNDDWTLPGPGARKGAALLLGQAKKRASEAEARALIVRLALQQESELEPRGFPWWHGGEYSGGALTRADIQNCLCEFYKYTALGDGKRPAVRRYHGGT